jgi:hypothetical protein
MKLEFSQQIIVKSSNIRFHENLPSVSRFVPCRQTDTTKLIVAFRNFANALKKGVFRWKFGRLPQSVYLWQWHSTAQPVGPSVRHSAASNVICRCAAMLWVESALGWAHRATHITALIAVHSYSDLTNFSTIWVCFVNIIRNLNPTATFALGGTELG